jgi:predicted enzyme related to lactoylglutathione lyase
MTDLASRFVWYELMTTDTASARLFYGSVVGWGTRDASQPGMTYTLFTVGESPVAGLMDLPEQARQMGSPPSWLGYISVADVDAAAAKAVSLGGAVHVQPADIPQVGRFAVLSDPQKCVITLFSPLPMPSPPQDPAPGTPGYVGWHELCATDWQKAFEFYAAMFGWQKGEPVDMGEMGTYQLFTTAGRSMPIGGMFNKPPSMPTPFWLFYFNVDDIDAALARVQSGGGKLLNGPMQVPGGDWIVQCLDPQGAMFALLGKRA